MTQTDVPPVLLDEVGQPGPQRRAGPATAPKRRRSWTRFAWIVLAAIVVVWSKYYVWPFFLPDFDPVRTFFTFRDDFPLHYPILVVHAGCGSVALFTACLQIWPWLRRKHPAVHRIVGRVYIFAGAIPTALALMILLPLRATLDGPGFVKTILMFWSALWIFTSLAGFRMARRRRLAEHRRWMAYSVAIAVAVMLPGPIVQYGYVYVDFMLLRDITAWVPWLLTLGIAHWWVKRRPYRVTAEAVSQPARSR